jgi:threonine dehydratase
MARALRGDTTPREPATTLADGVRVRTPGELTRRVLAGLIDDVVIVREAELRETLVRLALEEHVIAEGAGALALAAGRRVAGRRKCAVVSGGNLDADVLATLLASVRPRAPRKPRRRVRDGAAAASPVAPATTVTRLPSASAARDGHATPGALPRPVMASGRLTRAAAATSTPVVDAARQPTDARSGPRPPPRHSKECLT